MKLLIRINMVCWFALNAMATANSPTTLEMLRFAQDVEGLGLSKKKRIPKKQIEGRSLFINVKKMSL